MRGLMLSLLLVVVPVAAYVATWADGVETERRAIERAGLFAAPDPRLRPDDGGFECGRVLAGLKERMEK